ncbi:MAG TPA: hypothetical protein VGS20_04010 [Candidatus Acidoferrales bacterium]|nr:hypothetical protein [Candidatus Acidoferrales bacterium]
MRGEHPPTAATGTAWQWFLLAAILALYAATIARLGPAANFGAIQDDAIYFASAKALAAGQGYLLPSFPGGLATLKYPELYPRLLSWIWRVDPHFPDNVIPAIGLAAAFGCWFLAMCFLTAKKTMGLESGWSLAVAAFCGFNFFALLAGGSVLSDMPFAAMLLAAALAADRALEPGAHWGWAVAAGALAGTSVGLRAVGAAAVAGIALVALIRRAYSRAVLMGAAGGALALPWLLPAVLRALATRTGPAGTVPQGWAQTLAFYTSYVGQWRQFVPDWATQRSVLLKNSVGVLEDPGIYLLSPLGNRNALVSVAGGSVASLAAWAGMAARWRRGGWKAIHGMFLFYLLTILPWPFPPHRFFLPFAPLALGGLAAMTRDVAAQVGREFRGAAPPAKRVALRQAQGRERSRTAAAALGLLIFGVGAMAAVNCGYAAPRQLAAVMAARRAALAEQRQAYAWIRNQTPARARFIAYDDVLLYLYTGRQAVRPIAVSSASAYRDDAAMARREAERLGDVARQVDAEYWTVSDVDFGVELDPGRTIFRGREKQMVAHLREVFRSDRGGVRIYELK